MKKNLLFLSVFLLVVGFVGTVNAVPTQYNGNYYAVIEGGFNLEVGSYYTWEDANALANSLEYNGLTGHLATITSQAEWDFVTGMSDYHANLWLGGYQTAGTASLTENWNWVTGEDFYQFTAWAGGEPNDFGLGFGIDDENYLETYLDFSGPFWNLVVSDAWNDSNGNPGAFGQGYIVEFEAAAPVPEPGTIVLMGLGLVGLAGMGRKKLFKK